MLYYKDDLAGLGRGIAVLTTCIVQELAKSDPTFEERFLTRLGAAYGELRDNRDDDEGYGIALIAYTRSLITGFTHKDGQGDPFLRGKLD